MNAMRLCHKWHRKASLFRLTCFRNISFDNTKSAKFLSSSIERSNQQNPHPRRRRSSRQVMNEQRWEGRNVGLKNIQKEYNDFFASVKKYPPGMVALRVKEILLQVLNLPPSQERGFLASQLLEIAKEDLHFSQKSTKGIQDQNELRAKLYKMTIEAWTGTVGYRRLEALESAEGLLWEMLSESDQKRKQFYCSSFQRKIDNIQRNVDNINSAFSAVVFALCKDRKNQSSKHVRNRIMPLVDRIKELWNDPGVELVPDSVSMDAILYCHFKLQQPDDGYQVLREIIETRNNRFLKPTIHGMNTVISAYAKQGNVHKAKEIIELMLADTPRKSSRVPPPNAVSFNGLLDAISKRGGPMAGNQAEKVLEWMETLAIHPDTISYTTTISAWIKTQSHLAAEKAESILRHMIDLHVSGTRSNVAPNEVTLSSVIYAWSNSGVFDVAEKSMAVMEMMTNLYGEQDLQKEKLTSVFNSLMMAFIKSKKQNASNKVFDLLEQMKQAGVSPDATTHNAIMNALRRSGCDGPYKALQYFLNLETGYYSSDPSVQIDGYSYNIALDALSQCDRETAPQQATDLLKRMIDHGDFEPTTTTYNIVMKILARSSLTDSARRAEDLLSEMEASESSKPSTFSYATCISAWGYTRSPERYHCMRQLLLRMEASYKNGNHNAKPNIIPFNTLFIACCCGTDDRESALSCVLEALDHCRRIPGVGPNQNTYPVVLRSIGLNTTPGERRNYLLSKEFENCRRDGLVDSEVLRALQEASPQLLHSLLPHDADTSFRSLPHSWTRNVVIANNND